MKYIVMRGSVNKADGLMDKEEHPIGVFDNYLEAYGIAILDLNDILRDCKLPEGTTVSPLKDWGDYGVRMEIEADGIIDYITIYMVEDRDENAYKRWRE